MSKNAPDTRNKLDNNKEVKRIKPQLKKKKITQTELKVAYEKAMNPQDSVVTVRREEKLTKGQEYKKTHNHSKTMKRLMKKHGVETVDLYKLIRKERKLKEKKASQKKHAESVLFKRTHGKGKTKGKKNNQPSVVKEKKK